ncbi:MAG: T9SS type A sorting domain-containing protein [Bacteroidia bacterium]|nr:T9SS type A sorting domain-containing protein [Bacteroidia bacterium]MBP9179300.1 T9SS type A sorting domain-containing protein [Bacteroidia bacterium]MBP9724077.1 T9SS type A sorting domain-containing protein [Bacteroidia bacterium]
MKTKITKSRSSVLKIALYVSLLLSISAKGEIRTWTNGTSNGLWANAGNWSPAGIPSAADTVLFNGTSTGNCTINSSASIMGILIDSSYSGTIAQNSSISIGAYGFYMMGTGVFQASSSSITVNGPFELRRGTLTCSSGLITFNNTCQISGGVFSGNHGNIDFNSSFEISGGNFIASEGTTFFAMDINISGGEFHPNNGSIEINSSTSRTFDLMGKLEVNNLIINFGSSAQLNIANDDTIYVTKKLTLQNGIFASGVVAANDTILINSGWDDGNGTLLVNGSSDQVMIFNADWQGCNLIVDKPISTALKLTKGTSSVIFGNTSSNLSIVSGKLILPQNEDATINHSNVIIEINGELVASSATSVLGGNLQINEGKFTHNNGIIEFRSSTARTHNFSNALSINKVIINYNGVQFNIAENDTLVINKQLYLNNGVFNSGVIAAKDSITINNSWDDGNGTLIVSGENNQYMLFNDVWNGCNLILNKTTSSGTLNMVKGTAYITIGNSSTNLLLLKGRLLFPNNDTIDINHQNIIVEADAELTASSSLTRISSSIKINDGKFSHNNGSIVIDNSSTRTYQSTQIDTLYNLTLNCTSSSIIFSITNGDTIVVLNQLTFQNGKLDTGVILGLGNISFLNTSDNGTAPVIASGSGNTILNISANMTTRNFIINKQNATDTVSIINTLGTRVTSGGNTTQFKLISGIVCFPENDTVDFNFIDIIVETAGTWIATSTLSLVSSNVTVNGVFAHNNGNYTIDAGSSRNYSLSSPLTFFNFTQNQSGSLNIQSDDTLIVEGNLTLTNGLSNTGLINAKGNVSVGSSFDRGTAKLLFTGSGNQTFSINNSSNFDGDIILNKPNLSAVILSSPFSLDATDQELTLTKGYLVTTSTNLLTIADNRSISGGSSQAFISGPVRKVGNDIFTFPVGKDSVYAPISISAPSNSSHHFTAEYFKSNPEVAAYNRTSKESSINTVSANEFWILDRTNGTSNVTVTLSWNSARSGNITDTSDLLVTRWNGTQWVNHGKASFTGNTSEGTITTSSAITSFSPFTLGSFSGVNALPVELINFTAHQQRNSVELNWSTATEINNDYFEVERAANITDFTAIGKVNGHGNSIELLHYTFIDNSPLSGISYYRLKQVDFDGTVHYSSIQPINNMQIEIKNVYPNPASEVLNIETSEEMNHLSSITVYNLLGQKVTCNFTYSGNTLHLDVSSMNRGSYTVLLQNNSSIQTIRFNVAR